MVVSYTNNYGYTDAYANRDVNTLTTNGDGGGNGGSDAFMKMFEEQESEEAKKDETEDEVDPLDNLYNIQRNYYTNPSIIKDYIDNSLLINTEQVACTNITQHIALKSNVKETLKFLNTQAAKTMVNSRKRNYNFQTVPQEYIMDKKLGQNVTHSGANFFETRVSTPKENFFMR